MDAFEHLCQSRRAPASAEVYREVQQRMRELKDVRRYLREHEGAAKRSAHATNPDTSLEKSLSNLNLDKDMPQGMGKAIHWLFEVILSQEKLLTREQQLRMFRCAVEKELKGKVDSLTDMERVYMALSEPDSASHARVKVASALGVVTSYKLADKLDDVKTKVLERVDGKLRRQSSDDMDPRLIEKFIEKACKPTVDSFACAESLAALESARDVVDDNEGCCPICQVSYTDTSGQELGDLIADYPVTIKYCGHTLGKSCLEQWMRTKKIDEARYPHRTCPVCRVKIESVKLPRSPVYDYFKHNRRMQEMMRELVYKWDMEADECFDAILAIMSEEIAIEELSQLLHSKGQLLEEHREVDMHNRLEEMKGQLADFRAMFGLRGDAAWTKLRKEWQAKRADKSLGEGEEIFIDDDDRTYGL